MENTLKTVFLAFALFIAGNALSQTSKVDSMLFSKDYFPGTNDMNGKFMGSTETMSIVQHNGKLFAGMGNWMDYPITTQSEGTQVMRKDGFTSPWVVDTTIGYSSLRCDGFYNATFTMEYNGNVLTSPVQLLVGGFTRTIPPYKTSIWVRNDNINQWIKDTVAVFTTTPGLTGIRSFCIHTDQVTGKQWLFCGTASGSIFKAAYDPSVQGLLKIDTTQELKNLGRVMAMTVCEGKLYASAGVEIVNNDTVGGIYRRIDGPNPSWELVYRWPYDASINDDQNVMRGLTTIPDPLGSNHDVIIGARNMGGVIQIIEPFNNDSIYTELDVTDYFGNLWFNGNWPYIDYALIAYNNFTSDTINGEKVWWISLAIYAPNQLTTPSNGAYFLLRDKNGNYKWGYIYDNNHPVPNGKSLRASRTICRSPFPEEKDSVYYFGGYDCLNDTSHNTAWIYKGALQNSTLGLQHLKKKWNKVIIAPNPASDYITLKNIPLHSSIRIIDGKGKIVYSTVHHQNKDVSIETAHLPSGTYVVIVTKNNNTITRKFIRI